MRAHAIPENLVKPRLQLFLRSSFQHIQGLLVDVHQLHLAHAGIREIGIGLQICFQRTDPLLPESIKQVFDAAVIFLPKGNGGVFEQGLKMVLDCRYGHGRSFPDDK